MFHFINLNLKTIFKICNIQYLFYYSDFRLYLLHSTQRHMGFTLPILFLTCSSLYHFSRCFIIIIICVNNFGAFSSQKWKIFISRLFLECVINFWPGIRTILKFYAHDFILLQDI